MSTEGQGGEELPGLPRWRAPVTKWGDGKVHLLDDTREGRTMCGLWYRQLGGTLLPATVFEVTCKSCCDTPRRRRLQELRRKSWEIYDKERQAEREREEAQRKADYSAYLQTPQWHELRAKVLHRDKRICQGCGNHATQVHHLTYAHIANEFMFELVAVCRACHERLHSNLEDE